MHLICINHNNIINKQFSAEKIKVVAVLFTCVLTSMQKFCAARSEGGVKLTPPPMVVDPPPPSKKGRTCSQKAQFKIGLKKQGISNLPDRIVHHLVDLVPPQHVAEREALQLDDQSRGQSP